MPPHYQWHTVCQVMRCLGVAPQLRAHSRRCRLTFRMQRVEWWHTTSKGVHDMSSIWDGAEVISTYSRAQLIADGGLIEAPAAITSEAGFLHPVAFTAAAWADAVAWNDKIEARKPEGTGQDENGRLW